MIRFFSFILQIAALAAVALWLADRPGLAHIEWHGTVIETSAAFLGLCIVAVGYALHLLLSLWRFLRNGPALWRLRRRLDKMRQGQDQLAQGLVAIASGNATEAGRLAVSARKNLGEATAVRWLQAQAAQLAGDRGAAQEIFRALTTDPTAAVLGYRGLITEAKLAGNWPEVDRLMDELHRLKPATPWLSLIRMESAARRHAWDEAESALSHAATAHLLDQASGRRTRAALRVALSRQHLAKGETESALKAAEQAAQWTPDWLPASINLAETLAATGHPRAAHRAVERAWKKTPHPHLAHILRRLSDTPLAAYKQTERLCRANENAPESRAAQAEAALDAEIWGEARRHLMAAAASGTPTQSVYKKLAHLERRERNDERAAANWLAKAADAPTDPVWLCRHCGGAHEAWQPTCLHCNAFDALEWQSAGQSRAPLSPLCLEPGHD